MASMFSKRHYEAIAKLLAEGEYVLLDAGREAVREQDYDTLRDLNARFNHHAETVLAFAGMFARDNARFNPERFQRAASPYVSGIDAKLAALPKEEQEEIEQAHQELLGKIQGATLASEAGTGLYL